MRLTLLLLVIAVTPACGDASFYPSQDQGVTDSMQPDNGSWKVACFPDMGMCRMFRWQYSVVSANCEIGKGCRCSIGVGATVDTQCPLPNNFNATSDSGMAAMIACCFGSGETDGG